MLIRHVNITSLGAVVPISYKRRNILTGTVDVEMDGDFQMVMIVRSATAKGWVRSSTFSANTSYFTVHLASYIPRGLLTLELSAVPQRGGWPRRVTSGCVSFIATNSADSFAGELAANDGEFSAAAESEPTRRGPLLVVNMAVVAALSLGVLAIFKFKSNRGAARQSASTTSLAHSSDTVLVGEGFTINAAWQLHR
jgi:hypothetical protein